MATIRIPTPLRPYVGGSPKVSVEGSTVAEALDSLTTQYPEIKNHLFDGDSLRSFVNIYLNQEDIRHLDGTATLLDGDAALMIVPSIAGGAPARQVDQSALKVNQVFIMLLLITAFVLNSWVLVAFVGGIMLLGTAVPQLALFKQVYLGLLKPRGWVGSDVIADNPEPHRFAQGFGGAVVVLAVLALLSGLPLLGWVLAWLVVALAGLNFFLGFCAGCFVYYQLNKLGIPGFHATAFK